MGGGVDFLAMRKENKRWKKKFLISHWFTLSAKETHFQLMEAATFFATTGKSPSKHLEMEENKLIMQNY